MACILKTLLHVKTAEVISRQLSQRYIESLIRKAVGEIWRAEPTIRFHPSCLQRQRSSFPEFYNSILTELLWSAARPSLLSHYQLLSKLRERKALKFSSFWGTICSCVIYLMFPFSDFLGTPPDLPQAINKSDCSWIKYFHHQPC